MWRLAPVRVTPAVTEDQEKWKGGWVLNKRGRLELKSGNRFQKLFSIFASPDSARAQRLLRAPGLTITRT